MSAGGRATHEEPYAVERLRHITARAPGGLVFFLACVVVSSAFEIERFPERAPWMRGFAAGFFALTGFAYAALRRRPAWAVEILLVFVNVVGVALNAYHAIVKAQVAMCLWTLTGLMGSTAVILPWGGEVQALAAVGTLLSYPLHLLNPPETIDLLTWAAGGTYLLVVVAMSVFGAALYASHLHSGLDLASTLSEREARLQSYFDLAPVGTAILDHQGTFGEVNDELSRVLGHARDRLVGKRWFDLVHPDALAAARAELDRALGGATPGAAHDARLVRADGTAIDATVDMRGLPGRGGAFDHVMVLVRDVTERKRAEVERERLLARELEARQRAEAASRAKDEFLATISHELRTPLSPILAWSDLLRRRALEPEQIERGLAAIARNAVTEARLVDELLDVSRIVSGKVRLELLPVELAPVVLDAVDVIRSTADAKGIALETTIAPTSCSVMGDPDRLRQVLWNLLSNAVKFTPSGGRVHVTLGRDDAHARLIVADTGQGIPPAFLPFVFERFRQVDTTSTRRHGGLGIGLAIVRELVELHGGAVRVDSPGEGLGATFTVELPSQSAEQAIETARAAGGGAAALDGLQILVVDDDADSNEAVRTLLTSCGAEVRCAASAREARALAERWVPTVVVSDIAMPGEDGYALLAWMRAAGSVLSHVPTIALTAYSGDRDRERALAAGFHAHVAKPVRIEDLVLAVAAAARGRPGGADDQRPRAE